MKVWYYCSYSGSPVGFQLGCVDCSVIHDRSVALKQEKPPGLLDRCFATQGIREAFGKIPDAEGFFAIRPIARRDGDTHYLNFALETGKEDEYREYCAMLSFLKRYREHDDKALYDAFLKTIDREPSDHRFGFLVNIPELDDFLKQEKIYNPSSGNYPSEFFEDFFIRVDHAARGNHLSEQLRIERLYPKDGPFRFEPATEFSNELEGNWFYLVKERDKRHPQSSPKRGWLAVSIVSGSLAAVMGFAALSDKPSEDAREEPATAQQELAENAETRELHSMPLGDAEEQDTDETEKERKQEDEEDAATSAQEDRTPERNDDEQDGE